jgi:SAM-dependent methyltransferase
MTATEVMDASKTAKQLWLSGLTDEIQYWKEAIRSVPADSWEPRALRKDVAALLDGSAALVRILDVGAGPMTDVGSVWPGREVRVVAVDPLADAYNEILADLGIRPSVPTSWCHGELLHERFPANSFDLVFAQNALDHSYAPDTAIRSALHVLKPGATLLLRHWINEGERGNYNGLHQWNFDCQDGQFVIWNRVTRIDMSSILATDAEVICDVEEKRRQSGKMAGLLAVRIRKSALKDPAIAL